MEGFVNVPAGVQAKEVRGLLVALHGHRAGPKSSGDIDLAIIEPIAGRMGIGTGHQGNVLGIEVESEKTVFQGCDESAALARCNRADKLGQDHPAIFTGGGIVPIDSIAPHVDPVEMVILGIPYRSFSQHGMGIE